MVDPHTVNLSRLTLGPMQLRSLKVYPSLIEVLQALQGNTRVGAVGKRLCKPHDAYPISRQALDTARRRSRDSGAYTDPVLAAIAEGQAFRSVSNSSIPPTLRFRVRVTDWTPPNRGLSRADC